MDEQGRTALYRAAEEGAEARVRALAKNCAADVQKADNKSRTPIFIAAQNGHEAVARLLAVECGADVNKADNNGWTPIWMAAKSGHEAVVRLLAVECGADVNKPTDDYGVTPISAASEGHEAVVQLLAVECGADINKADNDRKTPISVAAQRSKNDVVALVAGLGAFPSHACKSDDVTRGVLGRPRALLQRAVSAALLPAWGEAGLLAIVVDYAQYTFEDWRDVPGCVPTLRDEQTLLAQLAAENERLTGAEAGARAAGS